MSEAARPLVLYHASCADGFTAAWAAWRHFGDGADYLPVNHGQPPPDVAGRRVYILDFSYRRDVLLGMAGAAFGVVVLDHHKTALAELGGLSAEANNLFCVFDMGKCGARLAWEYFHPGCEVPLLVKYVEDRDLWLWAMPHSREISAAIATYPRSFAVWDHLARVIENGADDLRAVRA